LQVSTVVLIVELCIAGVVLVAAIGGFSLGRRATDPFRALLLAALTGIGIAVVLLMSTRGLAAKYGPIVTRQMLLLCFSLALALIGGCGVGLARRNGPSPGVVVAGALVVGVIATLMGAFFTRVHEVLDTIGSVGGLQRGVAYEPQKNKDCPENLKSLYLAFQQYAQDWDALPPAANWMNNDDLVSKVRQNEWLHCPAVSNRHDEHYGYSYNDLVAGRKLNGKSRLKEMPDAAKTVLLFDSTNLAKSAHDAVTSLPRPGRHGGRNNLLFLDGHVETIAPK
jgi:prepilin-type processing-associated H-X9-DG protein